MKKLIFAVALCATLSASASIHYTIRDVDYKADTLFHAQIGPGTTHTSLFMRSEAKNRDMYVQYAITDLSNPYVTLSAVMGQDKYAGGERVSEMSKRKSRPGARYILGVNGDFFRTSGTSLRGESLVGAPIGTCIADGVVYHGVPTTGGYAGWQEFALTEDKRPMFGKINFGGTVSCAGKLASMGYINSEYECDGVQLFNDKYLSGTNLTGVCAEVQAVMAEGENFGIARPFKLVVTSPVSSAGDMDIPAGGYVIRGQGASLAFVGGLQVGDTVTFDIRVLCDGKEILPATVISSIPHILKDGQILDTEYWMSQFSSEQPLTVMGYDATGTKIIYAQIDGRSALSSGMRTSEGAELLRHLGASDGFNFDSGGSSTLYTTAFGTRNHPSDGTERNDANGFFTVYTAPDDSVVTSISFVDWVAKVPKFGTYQPKFFGYNQYGLLVDTDVQGVKVTCPESVGKMLNDSVFYGSGSGDALLTATLGNLTCTVPVQILGDGSGIAIACDSIITDGFRSYAVDVKNTVDGVTLSVDPATLSWRSTNENVVKINPNTGVLQGVDNGVAHVIGSLGEFSDTLKVIVEKPTAYVMPIDPNLDVATWKITQTGGKDAEATANGDGIDYAYTGASGRAPKILLSKTLRLWSLPDALRLRINPGNAPVKNFVLGVRANGESMAYQTIEPETIPANEEIIIELPTSSWIDADDMSKYPLTLSSIQLNMNTSTTGQQYLIRFLGFEMVYHALKPEALLGDVNGDGVVNVADVSALVNIILEGGSVSVADINEDGAVNVSDVSALVNIILQNP